MIKTCWNLCTVLTVIILDTAGATEPRMVFSSSHTDSRDGQTYLIVLMPDGKRWFAENLNYRDPNWSLNDVTGDIGEGGGHFGSWCYDNDSANCEKYGRLYTWDAAREACPAGWRLPTRFDFNILKTSTLTFHSETPKF